MGSAMTTQAALFVALQGLIAVLLAILWWGKARADRAYQRVYTALLETRGTGPGFYEALREWLHLTHIPLDRREQMIRANIGFQAAKDPKTLDFSGEILDVMTALQPPPQAR